ncbi:Hypothetical protein mma_2033 [Janthinobacterium sp. Marseille]|nr:GAF domain-containing protein [Janthinobacterium sp. Marseille]ABR90999.1 Hypothetical protein mma_2033 [Janthinobacterium sp. Marseille]
MALEFASPAFDQGRSGQEDLAHAVARIERLGKQLFGVSACTVHLHAAARPGLQPDSSAHQFCAQLALTDGLQVVPEKSSPFQAALGKIDNLDVKFYALQPVRSRDGQVIGRIGLIHERPRMFTEGDRHCLLDLVAVLEWELHTHANTPPTPSAAK